MKKLTSLIICIALLSPTAFADMQSVLTSVKERVDTSGYTEFNSEENTYNDKTEYSFYWSNDDDSLRISADENGNITDYHKNGTPINEHKEKLFSFSEQEKRFMEAQTAADKLNPNFSGTYKLQQNPNDSIFKYSSSFFMTQYYKDITVASSSYSAMNFENNEIQSYSYSPIDTSLFDEGEIMDTEAIKKAFSKNQCLELQYKADYDYKNKTCTITPIYAITNQYKMVDCITGELKEADMFSAFKNQASEMSADSIGAAKGDGYTKAEIAGLEEYKGLLTPEKLTEIVLAKKILALEEYNINGTSISKNTYDSGYSGSIFLTKDNKGAYITLDAKTGEFLDVVNTSYSSYLAESESKIEDYKEKALAYLKELSGNRLNEYKFYSEDESYGHYNLFYVRYVNGIPFYDDEAAISINTADGSINSFHIGYSKEVTFPDIKNAISKEKAEEILFENVQYEPVWCVTERDERDNIVSVSPLFLISNPYININAITSELSDNYPYNPYEAVKPDYKDLATLTDKEQINAVNALSDIGIGYKDSELEPNLEMTAFEFLTLLRNALVTQTKVVVGKDTIYDYSRGKLIEEGYIDEAFDGTAPVTKDFACTMITKMLGIDNISNLPGIYISPYTDVLENVGNIAVLDALGIVSPQSDGYFHPQHKLTRIEGLEIIYKALMFNIESK